MAGEILQFDWPSPPRGGELTDSVTKMVEALNEEGRLTSVHSALVQLLFKLADSLERASVGRGASVALLSAQYLAVVRELQALPRPVESDAAEFDVVLLPVVEPDENEDAAG